MVAGCIILVSLNKTLSQVGVIIALKSIKYDMGPNYFLRTRHLEGLWSLDTGARQARLGRASIKSGAFARINVENTDISTVSDQFRSTACA